MDNLGGGDVLFDVIAVFLRNAVKELQQADFVARLQRADRNFVSISRHDVLGVCFSTG